MTFYAYHIAKEETKRGYLTKEGIAQMINGTFKRKSYGLIRDLPGEDMPVSAGGFGDMKGAFHSSEL